MELRKYAFIAIFFIILSTLVSYSAEEKELKSISLETALAAYKENRFEDALRQFIQLNRTSDSAGLYYNMGNCHMKMGKTGLAIACYLSALKRDATDPDILHNLKYARSQIQDQFSEEKTVGFRDILLNLIRHFTFRQHQLIFLFLYFGMFILVIFGYILKKKWRGFEGILILAVSLTLLQSLFLYWSYRDYSRVLGVVTIEKTSLRYGPSPTDTEAFELHEGAEFEVYNRVGGWYQARLPDGKVGWISETQCAVIN